jgi:hypothetical protein
MSRQKGTPKTGGRMRGTPNRVTTDLRTWINDVLNNNRATFEADLQRLEPQQRLPLLLKLLDFAVPKWKGESKQCVDYVNRLYS